MMAAGAGSRTGRQGLGAAAGVRAAGLLLVLAGGAVLWGAFSIDWDMSDDWDAGVFVGWFPMSFEFLGLVAVLGLAGALVILGLRLLLGGRAGVRRRRHPAEVEKHWKEILRQDPKTRTQSKNALVAIGAPAVPKLVEVLARPNRPLDQRFGTSTHSTALRILDLMGSRADEPVRQLLLDTDPAIRRAAAEASSALRSLRAQRGTR